MAVSKAILNQHTSHVTSRETLQGKHLVVEVLWNLPDKFIPFLFIAEIDSGGGWLDVFVEVNLR